MRLKKIEIQGFKSFAYKTEIKIKDGITAIVGPNGSGKSNISDAIRWVLGEQSVKNLRGSRMEDVIFAGTSKKKPLGYCEVTITFDNTSGMIPVDYLEVAITRRMFRSGESQYYINKNSCRLMDIRELFMDTGIGKDGYSIIGQGRIDEILSNKPEDRRSIFEEAAGIVKFKSKKIQAEKKLDKTEDNVNRIKDLVFELSNQLETLEVEAEKASNFKNLYNELKDLEVNLFIRDIRKLENQIREINKEKKNLNSTLEKENLKREEIEEKFNIIKVNIDKLENEIGIYRDENSKIKEKKDKASNELSIKKEKENFYHKDLSRLIEEEEKLNKMLEKLNEEENQTHINLNKMKKEYNNSFEIYNKNKDILNCEDGKIQKLEKEIENEKNKIITMYNKSSDIKSQLNSILSFNENIGKRVQQLNKEINSRKEKIEEISLINKKAIEDKEKIEKDLFSINNRFEKNKKSLLNISNKLSFTIKEANKYNNQIENKLSTLKLLENMEEDYEGYYKGVKSILKTSKGQNELEKSIIGVVAELLEVAPKYEKAIEMALGSRSQNIVTPTESDAKVLIEYLKRNNLGRITCLPHNIIKPNILNLKESDKEHFKILGLGHELIKYNIKYDNIFKNLLGRTIIIEDIDSAINFANKYKHIYRIITLEGEILNPGGSLSGGSNYKNKINIINRRNRIDELKVDINNLKAIEVKLNKEEGIYRISKEELENEKEEAEKEIKNLEHKIISCNSSKEKYSNEISMLEELVVKSQIEIKELEAEKNNYSEKIIHFENELTGIKENIEIQKEKVKSLTISYNEKKIAKEEELKGLTDYKIRINEIKNEIKNLEEKSNYNQLEISKNNQELEKNFSLITSTKESLDKLNLNKSNLMELIKELSRDEEETKLKLDKLIKEKNINMDDFYGQQNKLNQTNKEINNKEKMLNSLDVKFTRNSVQLENYHKKLLDDYDLDFERALKYESKIENIKETTALIKELKASIKKIGNVNLASIEEYEKLKSRLDFILEQQKDLANARNTLKEVISDMERKMKDEFVKSFKKINENFKEIFTVLFDGGKAELILSNKEDILNSGIDINAQPPGKKLQNLSLLSGGEKSLTAVALLFSILNLKPAPFCILDEIDASLDEANISKYTNYLKTLADDTQFVLITHRKTTMEIVDVLYGVAMEEEGVSKLISVKLKDYIKEIAS